MAMQLVSKKNPTGERIRGLTDDEESAVKAYYSAHVPLSTEQLALPGLYFRKCGARV